MSPKTIIIIEDDRWLSINPIKFWQENFDSLLSRISHKNIEVNLLLTNDDDIARLNNDFRGKDSPTNVLSFPQYEICNIDTILTNDAIFIGDIAMSFDIIMRESIEFGITLQDRSFHLFVHGILHLLGENHENDEQATKMEQLEIEILNSVGIKNPYIL